MNSMLEYKGYHATIEFDADDDIFVGKVFGIADSLNFHGSSIPELKEMFEQCIDNYLEVCESIGKVPEKEFKGSFNVRIESSLHRRLAMYASRMGESLNSTVERAIEAYVEDMEKREYSEGLATIPKKQASK